MNSHKPTKNTDTQNGVTVLPPSSLPTPLITPDILKRAKAELDVKVPDYNSVTVDFTKSAPTASQNVSHVRNAKICDSVLDLIGKTPMVRLDRIAKKYGLKCELVAKCEFYSAGGSVKDRIAKRMVEEAEASGRIRVGDTLIEPTSGNTGVGLSLVAALKGYKMLITLPEKMSQEKLNTMQSLGAEIVRTPTEAAWNDSDSHITLALQLQKVLPNVHMLDQYINPGNPRAHYLETATEILYQCDNKIDMICITAGTGGTVTGIGAGIKAKVPNCVVVGIDPKGSILAVPEALNNEGRGESYLVEGIGYDFIPSTLDRKYVDEWIKTDDCNSFRFARELIRLEGLLVGGSSGSALAGAIEAAKDLGSGDRCVVILPDSIRNYMTKFASDDWMVDNGFYTPPPLPSVWGDKTVKNLSLQPLVTIGKSGTCGDAIKLMDVHGVDQIPIVDEADPTVTLGVVVQSSLSAALISTKVNMKTSVMAVRLKKFKKVFPSSSLNEVSRILTIHPFAVVCNEDNSIIGIVTRIDLLKVLPN